MNPERSRHYENDKSLVQKALGKLWSAVLGVARGVKEATFAHGR